MESIRKNNYVVMVNGKFMVKVQCEGSACAAEHMILDNYDGIQASQAFTWEDMKTEFFRDNLLFCEFITLEQLQEMSDEYKANWKKVSEAKEQAKTASYEVERLEKLLEDARRTLEDAKTAEVQNTIQARDFQKRVLGIRPEC